MTYKKLSLSGLEKLARDLSKKSGPENRVFGLIGPLGSGKTTFTKALAQSLGILNAKSPTFTIVHCYNKGGKSLYHVDLYRLEKVSELRAVGLEEILADENSLVVIEWVDKFPSLVSQCDTLIKFEVLKDNLRNVTVISN